MPTTDLRPKPRDYEIMQGDSFELPFAVRQPPADGQVVGDLVDFEGSTITGGGRKVGSNTTVDFVIDLDVASYGFDVDGDEGVSFVALWTKATTADLEPGVYDYNVKWVDSAAKRVQLSRGTITITAEVPT
jgi:hypothetical protein